jgi:fatty acid desaturase
MTSHAASPALNTAELQRRVSALRQMDNRTNWFYLVREYLFFGTVIGLAITFYHFRAGWGLGWGWNMPVTCLAVLLVGVAQHRLITLAHEASHYALFRNRLLNEVASDWLCMFPILSATHNYRLQHFAHHQYVNDPARDPDLKFMQAGGHRFRFPAGGRALWRGLVRQFLWVPGQVRYLLTRARHSVVTGAGGPSPGGRKGSRVLVVVGGLYLLSLFVAVNVLAVRGDPWLLGLVPAGMLALVLLFYALLPGHLYPQTSIKPAVTPRWRTCARMIYSTLLFAALGWLTYLTGAPWALYYLVLWVVPLVTVFPFLMIVREEVQHGDAGRERFSHSRLFQGNALVRFAVFPLGMDYHLPHHLFPMVPHYRLRELHALLTETEPYGARAPVVVGYLFARQSQRQGH